MHRTGFRSPLRPSAHWLLLLPLLLGLSVAPLAFAEDEPETIERDIESANEYLDEGFAAREEHLVSEAADAFWKAVESDPLNYRACVHYQETALAAGDPIADIQRDFDKFVEDYPTYLCFKLHRMRLDAPDARLEALTKLAKSKVKSSDVHLEIGRVLLAKGQAKSAVEALTKALALKVGDRPDVLLLLAEAEHAVGKTEAAMQRLDAAVKAKAAFFQARVMLARLQLLMEQPEPAAANADVVVKQRPSYIAAFLIKSEALLQLEKEDEARETLKAAYRINKEVDDVVIAYADLWARQETEASYQQAVKLYQEVVDRNEESWRALYGQGWVLERLEKFEEAEEKYREVAGIRPSSVAAINSVGYVLFKQGRVSEAQVQFKRALDLDETFVTAMANLGATLDAQAKYGEAIKIYEQVLKMKGQEDNLRALINCAFDYEAVGSLPKAQTLLLRAHKVLPEDPNIVVWIGDNNYFQRKWKDAEKWYQQAIAIDEKLFFGWRGLGLTMAQRKRWSDAAQALEKASKLKPEDLEMYVILGDIYYGELKDLKSALTKYEEFVQRGGNDPEIRDAILEIKKELAK
ncbi:MAG: tetratricopeptide repeat protein [Planctomycetota bacterium]|nr:tetratricopeptide repeat protein [Planctomycetota bacterium]